jgi:hypothetical protein
MNRVVHFEIQADDVERAKKFYENVLGWKIEKYMNQKESGMMDYWLVMTGQDGVPGINGGIYKRPAEDKLYTYDCTVDVVDIDIAVKAVKANGGTITREKSELPGVGWFASAKDTEGNRFALMQAHR